MKTLCAKWNSFSMSILGILAIFLMGLSPLAAESPSVKNENTDVKYTDLQQALDEANPGDTLKMKGTFVGSFFINKSLTLEGGHHAVLDGNNADRVLDVSTNPDAIVTLKHLTIQNGNAAGPGGGIINIATLTLENVKIIKNVAGTVGGGIFNANSVVEDVVGPAILNIIDSEINKNHAPTGGGIVNSRGILFMRHCKVEHNNATEGGGGGLISNTGSNTIHHSTFKKNSSITGGAGIALGNDSIATLLHVKIEENSTLGTGGGIFNFQSTLNIDRSEIKENIAGDNGGGILCGLDSVVNLANSKVTKNVAADGGGVFIGFGTFNPVNSEIEKNTPNDISGV